MRDYIPLLICSLCEKDPKPFSPVRGPLGASASVPNQDGEETHSAQTALAKMSIRGSGSAASEGSEMKKTQEANYLE